VSALVVGVTASVALLTKLASTLSRCRVTQLPDGEKGLENNQGQYNCFINVVIQALWHLTGKALTAPSCCRPVCDCQS
jgi:hypothetical protein